MEFQVLVQVAAGLQGAKLQDGLGAFQSPAGARQGHPVLHQVAAGPFDHAGRDWESGLEGQGNRSI